MLVGRISQARGRRPALTFGYVTGGVGAVGVVSAAALDASWLLLLSLPLYGAGVATNLQARYAGADLADPARRGQALSAVLVLTTLGAVLGPNLVEPLGELAADVGIRRLAGPFMLAAAAYLAAGLAVQLLLRPDPLVEARRLEADAAVRAAGAESGARSIDVAALRLGAAAMIVTQLVMVAVMTMTPVHMRDHGHTVGEAGMVISLHIAAMFLPSPLTGRLVDRVGRHTMLAASAVTLLAAGLLGALAPPASMGLLALALVLLGLGWNFGLIGGTALLTDAVPLESRARVAGLVDVGVALAGATGGLASGFVVDGAGFAALSLAGGLLSLALLPGLLIVRR